MIADTFEQQKWLGVIEMIHEEVQQTHLVYPSS